VTPRHEKPTSPLLDHAPEVFSAVIEIPGITSMRGAVISEDFPELHRITQK
jgi:hypothetical protein